MTRLLIYDRTLRRVADRLSQVRDIELVVLDDSGALTVGGHASSLAEAKLDVAWTSVDLYTSPVRTTYLQMTLDAPSLKWVQVAGAGVNEPVYGKLVAKGVRVTSSHGHALAIAEYVLWGVLDHFQGGPDRRALRTSHTWRPAFFREVMDTHWLLIGFGAIGQGVAVRARAFGAKITAIRRNADPHPLADSMASMRDLSRFLSQADVVVLCLPLTGATTNLVDATFLAAMRANSVLVNVGRGGLVDEAALLSALDAGTPAHAVLDVFQTEPLPKESPFWDHPRVTLTCHTAAVTEHLYARGDDLFFENLQRFVAGRDLLHQVGPDDVNG